MTMLTIAASDLLINADDEGCMCACSVFINRTWFSKNAALAADDKLWYVDHFVACAVLRWIF